MPKQMGHPLNVWIAGVGPRLLFLRSHEHFVNASVAFFLLVD